ncbi:AI-2E family transporter [Clostridium akagii]|uniref:AI-2E family transporter n=1 Tax=Clostridium akagii TaxID=91623 RepID=UPI00047E315F|nr:AI-2E family transporter [Clostridium akagii]
MKYDKKVISIAKYLLIIVAFLVLLIKYSEKIISQLRNIGNAALPLVSGLIIAYVLNILMKKLEKIYFPKVSNKFIKKSKRIVCIFLSILLIIGMIVIIALIVIPQFVNTVSGITDEIPIILKNVKNFITVNSDKYEVIKKGLVALHINIDGILQSIMSTASDILNDILNSIFSLMGSLTNGLMNFIIGVTFAIYALVNKEKLLMQIRKVMSAFLRSKSIEKIEYIFHVINNTFSNFILGQCVQAVIKGCLCTVGMLIFGFPYAIAVGAFIGVTGLIPVLGTYLGAALGAFMVVTVSPMSALLFLIFIFILDQLESNLIYPRVVGLSIGLPGIWVFGAIIVGGELGGIVGMLLSVPIVASIYKFFVDKVNNRLSDNQIKSE